MSFDQAGRSLLFAIGLLIASVCSYAHAQESGTEFEFWTGAQGKKIRANVIGFDPESKKVIWGLPGGRTVQSPLESLSDESRTRVLGEPGITQYVTDNLRSYDPGRTSAKRWIVLIVILLTLLLLIFLVDFVCFKLSVRFIAKSHRDLAAYLKLFVAQFILSLLGTVLFAIGRSPSILDTFIDLLSLVAWFVIIIPHYQIGFWRALFLGLLRLVVVTIAILPVTITVVFLMNFQIDGVTTIAATFVDDFIYRPLDMIP